ncbi:transporter substrate-binding domain-containing protein [Ruegeria sp. 2205SS24-7]|uniref:transporter substrate-binding domain-containing protein n=1 Tax=Ruegeria discodermiae TaxID=3064389 RepID=UPI00274137D3|nr:transporter substrate-binding domain-containing protein [Ruegeria sp. 2205SS24-7]MDP5217360.1 transporter substrate-binding domain-containing protein [Ruegeria sp. 2205SS24-7]
MKFAYLMEPPFNYLDEGRKVTGCDVELARDAFRQLGFETVEFVETEFAHLLPGLACGDRQIPPVFLQPTTVGDMPCAAG